MQLVLRILKPDFVFAGYKRGRGENDKVIDKDDNSSAAVSRVDSMKVVPSKEENQSTVVTPATAKGEDKSSYATNIQKDLIKNDKIMDVNGNIKKNSNKATVPKIDSIKVVPPREKENKNYVANGPATTKRKGTRSAARKKEEPPKKTAKKEKSNFGGLKKGFLL